MDITILVERYTVFGSYVTTTRLTLSDLTTGNSAQFSSMTASVQDLYKKCDACLRAQAKGIAPNLADIVVSVAPHYRALHRENINRRLFEYAINPKS